MVAAAALPDDLLAVVLGRLPARSLATSRGVCKAWRDLINPLCPRPLHQLSKLLQIPLLVPADAHIVAGIRLTCAVDAMFDFVERQYPNSWYEVADHCNGLVPFAENHGDVLHVCNPAMRWSVCLPPQPSATCYYRSWARGRRAFLLFDPFVSPVYKVVLSPAEPEINNTCRLMQWPPSAWTMWYEFSSSTGRWEEKVFIREGEAAGIVGDLLLNNGGWHHIEPPCRYAVYWNGSLYMHWHGEFITRLSLHDEKYSYRVIRSPLQLTECKNDYVRSFLGRSEKGVYIAAIASKGLAILRVSTLNESSGDMEWVPKDQRNLKIDTWSWSLENNEFNELKYWILDVQPQYRKFDLDDGVMNQDIPLVEQKVCWDSDEDNIVDVSADEEILPYVTFLGFHPYKEVIFLCRHSYAVAFHLNSPKVQYLGNVHPGEYHHGLRESFVYTPCLIRDY